jgi:hypothetical protein
MDDGGYCRLKGDSAGGRLKFRGWAVDEDAEKEEEEGPPRRASRSLLALCSHEIKTLR